jgi:adenylate cyclase
VQPDAAQRAQACCAALDVMQASEQFSRSPGAVDFATRIGLHAGTILLGNIGSAEHLEYRAVGDIVNTSARLQALNKVLGTRVLVSRETVAGLDEFALRDLGMFRLPGKTRSLGVVELCGFSRNAGGRETELRYGFAAALAEFSRGEFARARTLFVQLLEQFQQDGPAQYYLGLCDHYLARPPGPAWDGVVTVTEHRASRRQEL